MTPPQDEQADQKRKITEQVAALSRLLGMIPSDGTITLHAPMGQDEMALSEWLGAARNAFLGLSLSISRELNIQLQ